MLERLDEIDWYQLGHAYGDASDVPDMIRALTSPDEETREQSWEYLFASARHQGDVYDSTPQVVPFLIELLAEPSVPGKAKLLEGLIWWSPDYESWAPYYGEPDSPDAYSLQTRRAIEEGMTVYVEYLDSPESIERIRAARLLTLCFSRRDDAVRAIQERFGVEKAPVVRSEWVLQVGIFNRRDDVAFLAEVARHDPDSAVRLAAALAWVHVEADDPPEEAAFLIDQAAESPEDPFARLLRPNQVVDRALEALKKRGGADVGVLLKLLRSPSVGVRKEAVEKLSALDTCLPQVVKALVCLLSDDSVEIRRLVAFQLGYQARRVVQTASVAKLPLSMADLESQLGEVAPVAVAGLAERLSSEEDPRQRVTLCRALMDLVLWAAPAVPALRKAAAEESEASKALWIIEALQREDVRELFDFSRELNVVDRWVARQTIVRVGRQRPEEVVPILVEGLGAGRVTTAAHLLAELGPAARNALPALQKVLAGPIKQDRKAAAEAIRAIDPGVLGEEMTPDEAEVRRQLGESPP